MNIYLTGAHGCGKTTTSKKIAEKSKFQTLPSVARTSPYEVETAENQRFIMNKVYARCLNYDNYIHERTPVDVISYTKLMKLESEYNHQKMKVEAFFRGITHTGSPIFYFPIYFDLEHDGIRPGLDEQVEVDKFIHDYLETNGIPYYTIPDTTPEERADFILERVA